MDKKEAIKIIYKNRVLIMFCAVLIFGSIFGICVLKIIPEEVCENLFLISSKNTENFFGEFLNKFCFSAIMLTMVYFSGLSIVGKYTSFFAVFLNGACFSFINGINYMFAGTEYFINAVVSYFTSAFYFGFMLIIMAENSFFSSVAITEIIKSNNAEKAHFKAKNITVKYIGFTAVLALFSAFSAYISIVIQSIL